jgi:hypothetical protein
MTVPSAPPFSIGHDSCVSFCLPEISFGLSSHCLTSDYRGKPDAKYKDEMIDLFRELDMVWPPTMSDFPEFDPQHLSDRAQQFVVYVHKKFPPHPDLVLEFVDAQPSIQRILTYDDNSQLKNPWRSTPGTLTGFAKIVVRYNAGAAGVRIRPMSPEELFACMGWFPASFKRGLTFDSPVLPASLAGNAFSAFHLCPLIMGLVSCAGCINDITLPLPDTEAPAHVGSDDSDSD